MTGFRNNWSVTAMLAALLGTMGTAAFAGSICGNGTCDAGEDTCNCVEDCPRTTCAACDCGSSAGVPGRDCFCDADCVMFADCCDNACAECDVGCCGNGVCDAGEDSCNCLADCPRTTCQPCDCGSGSGTGGRDCFCDDACVGFGDCCPNACEVCGECPPVCGDGTCEGGENCESCPADCGCSECQTCQSGSCISVCDVFCDPACCGGCTGCEADCGDGECSLDCSESCENCPADCGGCPGACCFPNSTAGSLDIYCEQISESECLDRGGSFAGAGTVCPFICQPQGACCLGELGMNVAGNGHASGCVVTTEYECVEYGGGDYLGDGTTCESNPCNPERVDISTKGSLLIFSDVELEWTQGPIAGPGGFNVSKDTIISLTNDYPGEVYVQMYFINGDPERDAVFSGGPVPILISEQEPGCNWVDCAVLLTPDQSVYWSAASGNPVGCQPFGILDPDLGNGPGRPNPDVLGGPRVLRGYIVAWAVDANGHQINWNHLSGKATIVDYAAQAAWEYSPWAFQAFFASDNFGADGFSVLALDGVMYENAFDMLLFDFFAAGSMALSSNGNVVSVDTDLTLHPVTHDLRQEHRPPVTTKAHFDIWNMNERKLSNTRRCITCWDQVLLSQFGAPNNFLLANLQSDKGKARIDGKQADECEENCFRDMGPGFAAQDNQTAGFLGDLLDLEFVCSDNAALLGVAAKILRFGNNSIDYAGSELVGMGVEPAFILYDVVGPPGTLRDDTYGRIRPIESKPTRLEGSSRGK